MSFMQKFMGKIFGNLDCIPAGLEDIGTPIGDAILRFMDSTVYKVLYFIPLAIIRIIRTTVVWYYDNFMDNPAVVQTDVQRLIFIYLIPGAVIASLIFLLSLGKGYGWYLLFASPLLFVLFPIFAYCGFFALIDWWPEREARKIENRKCYNTQYFPLGPLPELNYDSLEIGNRVTGITFGLKGEKLLDYALNLVGGRKKILFGVNIPVGDNEVVDIDAVLINKYGVHVWSIHYYINRCLFGLLNADIWYRNKKGCSKPKERLEKGEMGPNFHRILNPLKENRYKVNLIQNQLRAIGLQKARMFSGITLPVIDKDECYFEVGPDETIIKTCDIPKHYREQKKILEPTLTNAEIDIIAKHLSQFVPDPATTRDTRILKYAEKYGADYKILYPEDSDMDELIANTKYLKEIKKQELLAAPSSQDVKKVILPASQKPLNKPKTNPQPS